MAVTLRLARHGQKKRPFYRIVAAEKECRRDGRFIEILGTYNPMQNPPEVTLKEDKVAKWLGVGAQTTQLVRDIIVKQMPGKMEELETARTDKVRSQRKKRKERAAARA